jgi:hypothetical protein
LLQVATIATHFIGLVFVLFSCALGDPHEEKRKQCIFLFLFSFWMEGVLNFYHVKLPLDISLGYDSYSEFVVVAESAEEARSIHPSGSGLSGWMHSGGDWIDFEERSKLIVTHIGVTITGGPAMFHSGQVIVASFHAG